MEAVVLDHLSKTYSGGKEAVRQVSLVLGKGEVFGFLGPNGAGKTTTVKLLNGMLLPTAGSCRVLGNDPAREPEKVHARSGVVTEHAQMYDNLTGLQNLMFYASIFGMAESQARERANELLGQLELGEAANQKLSAYSTGMPAAALAGKGVAPSAGGTFSRRAHIRSRPGERPERQPADPKAGEGGGHYRVSLYPSASICPGDLHPLRPDGGGETAGDRHARGTAAAGVPDDYPFDPGGSYPRGIFRSWRRCEKFGSER